MDEKQLETLQMEIIKFNLQLAALNQLADELEERKKETLAKIKSIKQP